jgi:hypothetical protein
LWVDLVAETLNDMAEVKVLDLVVAREDVEAWYDAMARDELRVMPVVLPSGEIRKGVKPLAAVAWRLGLDLDAVKFTVVDDLPQVVHGPCGMIPVTPFLGPHVADKAAMRTLAESLCTRLLHHVVDGIGYEGLAADVGDMVAFDWDPSSRFSRDFTCGDLFRHHALSDVLTVILDL